MTATNPFSDFHKGLPTPIGLFGFHSLKFMVAVHALPDGGCLLVFYTAEETEGTAGKVSAAGVTFVKALSAL